MPDLVLCSDRVVTPAGVRPAAVVVRDGVIQAVEPLPWTGGDGVSVEGALLPGLVDTHVHINEPGRTTWGGFGRTSEAAARGGVTTLVDMPLNSVPVTTSCAALDAKRHAAEASSVVDYGFWGGVVPGNAGELVPLIAAGVLGFKCFLVPSGIEEFEPVDESDLRRAMPILGEHGVPLLVHAELPGVIARAAIDLRPGNHRRYARWLASRPAAAEVEAIELLIALADESGCPVHIVHLAAGDALAGLRDARDRGVPVSVETCPHYLTFSADDVPDGATAFKCAPPIRTIRDREALWDGLRNGVIDLVATDHSPCPDEMKQLATGDFVAAWGGIATLPLSLSVVWTEAQARGFELADIARWMATAPARLAGLSSKGAIAPGHDADFAVLDPEADLVVGGDRPARGVLLTPYHRRALRGVVKQTWIRGVRVFDGTAVDASHQGKWLEREHP